MKLKTYILLLAIFVLSPIALYFGYEKYQDYQKRVAWHKLMEPYEKEREAWAKQKATEKKLLDETEAMLRADHYGGKTPEETLALFVDALKKRDYKLAAKYYLPWKQKEAEKDLKKWLDNENAVKKFLDAYNMGIIYDKEFVGETGVYIKDSEQDKYPYAIMFTKNKINKIWKISEFD